MSPAVGIDLGTTNSAIAAVDSQGQPKVLPNRFGEAVTPSVICFQEGEVIVGQPAKELQASGAPQVAAFFKRQMGDANYVFYADGQDYSATDLSALVLSSLKSDAEHELGSSVRQAVITVPAYFRNPQRQATIAAGEQAGLEVLQVINEPTAAAVAYGLERSSPERTLLVYDLGGGTFDVTLLRLSPQEVRILTSEGDHELGGKDWDDRIVEFLASRFEQEYGTDPLDDLESLNDLLVRAEEVKKRLSAAQSAPISIVHGGDRGRYELGRATFEEITSDLMERTVSLTMKVLEDQGLRPQDVSEVLLVGGSTRMPMVDDFIRRSFGRPPSSGVNVDEAVALGAALTAARNPSIASRRPKLRLGGALRTVDVTNHSLGMIALNEDRSAFVNSIILPKDTPVPSQEVRPYQHRTRSGGGLLEIYMTQGESESPAEVTYLGKYVLHGIPANGSGLAAVIDIEYSYDLSGTVQVGGSCAGRSLKLSVEDLPPDVPERFLKPPEETVESVHLTAYLAFDLSGSMSGQPLEEARKAAMGFLSNTDLSHCSLGIIAFADSVQVKLKASQNARKIKRAIQSLSIGELGYTNLAQPFSEVRKLLAKSEQPKFVVTLADGVWADQGVAIREAHAAHLEGIESIAIGFGGADRSFLRAIASSDEASFFTSMNGLVETFSNIAQVLTRAPSGQMAGQSVGSSWLGLLKRR